MRIRIDGPPITRLLSKIEISEGGCWLWMGGRDAYGYGRFWDGQRKVPAHRAAYELLVGSIPDGLVIDHLCRVPACVNPDHLEPVTQGENVRRGNAVRSVCVNGHPYTTANTYRDPKRGHKQCRICRAVKARELRARRAAVSAEAA